MAMQGFELALAEINHCNKCGFCLPACPTYQLTGNEVDSPRGRIAMVEGVLRDEIAGAAGLEESLSYCLGCRACETACPSGVQYHRILEAGKKVLDKTRPSHRGLTFVPRTLLKLTHHPKQFQRLARWGRRVENWPMPASMKTLTPMLHYDHQTIRDSHNDAPNAPTVQFFSGCVQEAFYDDANQAAIELMRASGYQVTVPDKQTCCGAVAWHAGRENEAKELARQNMRAFSEAGDAVLANTAGGCGAMLKEYQEIFSDDPTYCDAARRLSERVRDWSTLVDPSKLNLVGSGQRVTLQNSCHLLNVEGGGDVPERLAEAVDGDVFVKLPSQDRCCGSAGIYNIQHPDWSLQILDGKMAEVEQVVPDRIVVVNPGCQLQMTLGVHRSHEQDVVVEHLARYIYDAYQRGKAGVPTG